jgi:hypothetical protein
MFNFLLVGFLLLKKKTSDCIIGITDKKTLFKSLWLCWFSGKQLSNTLGKALLYIHFSDQFLVLVALFFFIYQSVFSNNKLKRAGQRRFEGLPISHFPSSTQLTSSFLWLITYSAMKMALFWPLEIFSPLTSIYYNFWKKVKWTNEFVYNINFSLLRPCRKWKSIDNLKILWR